MDHRSGKKRAGDTLYPPVEPFDRQMLDVGDGHQLYVEQSGNPSGVPVLVVHGGPGGGCSPTMRRFFDPAHYRVVMFDQRGCGRSRPAASVEANTTWHLVADMERIRERLGIGRFILFGGSWGATLALIFAITHPERVSALVLRGVFLGTEAELEWFYGGGAARFFPEIWARFIAPIPEAERADLIAAYHRRLFSGDRLEEARLGRIWANWENALASVHYDGIPGEAPSDYARTFARLENHYFTHRCFMDGDDWIMRNRRMIEHLPARIVQGRLDMICPPRSAFRLAEGWELAEISMIPLAGHALSEPGISQALVGAMNGLRAKIA
ncbi:prolyl aminopeptidase [Falsirhodobacter deserti]|uniref:prolyl aminopeptidase n=1 Tax=Falsirhodobacter deserti TaxID=1365611 RepID=UPI000FE3EDCD|nr:prolyl aminopeptidase [Falsirhodobacter deserti]